MRDGAVVFKKKRKPPVNENFFEDAQRRNLRNEFVWRDCGSNGPGASRLQWKLRPQSAESEKCICPEAARVNHEDSVVRISSDVNSTLQSPAGTVLITGATGYLGRALIPAVLARGYRVRALVRRGSEGKLPAGVEPVAGDALDPASVSAERLGFVTLPQMVRALVNASIIPRAA